MKRYLALAFCPLALSACDPQAAKYPSLLPTDQILAEPALPAHSRALPQTPEAVAAPTLSEAEALRRRADALRGPVIEPETRAMMQKKIAD